MHPCTARMVQCILAYLGGTRLSDVFVVICFNSNHCLPKCRAHPCIFGVPSLVCMSVQTSLATSERSFSKAGLIVAAKRMVIVVELLGGRLHMTFSAVILCNLA